MSKDIEINSLYGNLKVLKETDRDKHGRKQFLCLCLLCNNTKPIKATNLRTGKATSCNCDWSEKIGKSKTKYGKSQQRSKEYNAWMGMRVRCRDKNYHAYHRYGGRGITICKEWESFEAFHKDMGDAPFKNAQLDRIDNDKGYSPENCRWVTPKENSNNRGKQKSKSGYTGVFYKERLSKYEVNFSVNRKHKYVGVFKTLEEAVNARKHAIIKYNEENGTKLKYEEFIE